MKSAITNHLTQKQIEKRKNKSQNAQQIEKRKNKLKSATTKTKPEEVGTNAATTGITDWMMDPVAF